MHLHFEIFFYFMEFNMSKNFRENLGQHLFGKAVFSPLPPNSILRYDEK